VSSGSGCLTTCLLCCCAFGLEVRIEVGARGHERKQGAPDGVGGGREGDLGGLVLLGGAGAQTVAPGPGLLADGCGQVQDRPPAPGRALPADPKPGVSGPDWLRAGSSPAARHTFDHSAHRSVEPTKATNPAAATTPTPRSWVSLAPWVWASRGAMAASRQAISRSRVSIVLNDGVDDDPRVRRFLDAEVPMRRWAAPEELAGATLLLTDPQSAYVTGTVLPVDGGWTSH
jgi:hypothetical protein